jgi:S1-C subfamily serine protease
VNGPGARALEISGATAAGLREEKTVRFRAGASFPWYAEPVSEGHRRRGGAGLVGIVITLLLLLAASTACVLTAWLLVPHDQLPWREGTEPTSDTPTAPADSQAGPQIAAPAPFTPRGDLAEFERTTISIFQNAAPSVVYITRVEVVMDLFRRNVMEHPSGTGSGFVWDNVGHVVTNYHVVEGADQLRVTLEDHTTWPAQVVGSAPNKDLAVLKVEAPATRLRPLPVGTSQNLLVGQSVFAIGNPFGLDQTLSSGVISGLDREINAATGLPIQGVIQTDAAINPGNSGGPLLDSAGHLIGVNTAIYSPSGASAGIGFAVPVDTVRRIVPQLIQHGRVYRPGLGISIGSDVLARKLGITTGVLVMEVPAGSAAANAGMRPTTQDPRTGRITLGDVLLAIEGEKVETTVDLYRILDRREVGDEVTVSILRGGVNMEVSVELSAISD